MSKILDFFNSLTEDKKKEVKELFAEIKAEDAPTQPAAPATEVPLMDGTVAKVMGDGVGAEIILVTPEGEVPAPEGEHVAADGSVIVVKKEGEKSVIAEIKPAEDMKAETNMNADLKALEDKFNALFTALETENKALKSELEKVKLNFSKHKAQFVKTVEVVEAMAAIPTDEPAKTPETSIKPNKKEEALKRIFGK